MATYHPLRELTIARTKVFIREPEAIFWVYAFPILLIVGLGIAFGGSGREGLRVAITDAETCREVSRRIDPKEGIAIEEMPLDAARSRYADGTIDCIVCVTDGRYEYIFDPSRSGSEAAKLRVNDALQNLAGRKDPIASSDTHITEPGSRYIDWLIPGLIGMNIMGGGMWGVGFHTVDLRMRKLLKRFVATPMRRSDFLLSLMGGRLLFLLTEVAVILLVGWFGFGLAIRGSLVAMGLITLLGAAAFSGLGLLTASRTDKIETIIGLLNFIMLPMYLLSGVFFSAERFPAVLQPLVQALPLTQLNNALREVMLRGATLESQWLPAAALTFVGLASFALALRWFRWQ